MHAENTLNIGTGFYTIPDISRILRMPYHKVSRWVNRYWDGELGAEFEAKYSWIVDKTKAVSFHTLIEFYVLILLADAGVKIRQVLNAHKELSQHFDTLSPFAQKNILRNIRTDGYRIYINLERGLYSLDGTQQFNLEFIEIFFKNLDFGSDLMASRFWPLGKDKAVVIDPGRQLGHPVVGNTNIFPETLYNMYKSGESIDFIAFAYEIEKKDIRDAIDFCNAA